MRIITEQDTEWKTRCKSCKSLLGYTCKDIKAGYNEETRCVTAHIVCCCCGTVVIVPTSSIHRVEARNSRGRDSWCWGWEQ